MSKGKVLVAMSGGVDSSVALYLLKEQGYDCIGVTLKLYNNDDLTVNTESTCCSLSDIEDAKSVAAKLGIPHYVFQFRDKFKERVMDPFIDSYLNGETPNPCINCNRYIKFAYLYQKAKEVGCDYIATGHYARAVYDEKYGSTVLKKGLDSAKDQSYVLYNLTREQLEHTIFPLGKLTKAEVRQIAEKQGFINAKKHESQDICFVPDGDYAAFIEKTTGKPCEKGNFVDTKGNILGEHRGIIHYTIGQRKGLRIAVGEPMYVKEINPQENTVVLAREKELYQEKVFANDINLSAITAITTPIRVRSKVRYRQESKWGYAEQQGDTLSVTFDVPEKAIAKGQALVIYDEDNETVLGGGTLC